MATDQDFGDFTVATQPKPNFGVTPGDIPPKLAELLAAEHVKALASDDHEMVITVPVSVPKPHALADNADQAARDAHAKATIAHNESTAKAETDAKRLAGYARAWGALQEPKLRITKVSNGKRYSPNIARLSVAKEEEVAAENRPGRRAGR